MRKAIAVVNNARPRIAAKERLFPPPLVFCRVSGCFSEFQKKYDGTQHTLFM